MMALWDVLQAGFDKADAARPFLVVDGKPTRYGGMADRILRQSALFKTKGLKPGDRIGVISADPVAMSALLLAGIRSGVAMVNLNPAQPRTERWRAVIASDLAHVFIDEETADEADALPPDTAHTVITAPKAKSGGLLNRLMGSSKPAEPETGLAAELAATAPDAAPPFIDPEATALMVFTSGTTSQPKIVELSQANLLAQLEIFAEVFDYDPDSRILNILPMHFTDGLLHGPLATLAAGASLYRTADTRFEDIGAILHGVYRDRISHFILVPALLSLIDRMPREFDDAFDTPDFRYIRSSADFLPEDLWARTEERFGVRVCNTYSPRPCAKRLSAARARTSSSAARPASRSAAISASPERTAPPWPPESPARWRSPGRW
jgi:acyl-coenzyme A synthetase/AMP-(fatty) acid ligase